MTVKIALLGMMFGLLPIILIHELGHYLAARLLRVDVDALFIGIPVGKLRLTTARIRETRFVFGPLLLGGLCKFKNDPPTAVPWKMAIIMAAGPLVNIVLGIMLMKVPLSSWFYQVSHLFYAMEISQSLISWNPFITHITRPEISGNFFGPLVFMKLTAWSLGRSLGVYLYLLGILNISMGITNLLPIPPLDGGQTLVSIGEWISHRHLPESPKLIIFGLGAAVCVIFFGWIVVNDFINLWGKT